MRDVAYIVGLSVVWQEIIDLQAFFYLASIAAQAQGTEKSEKSEKSECAVRELLSNTYQQLVEEMTDDAGIGNLTEVGNQLLVVYTAAD